MITLSLLAGLAGSLLLNITLYRVLGRDAAWGVGAQGAYLIRLRWVTFWAWLFPVDVLHLDIDRLKHLNAVMSESRVNALLRQALRASDIYRSQHGDELMLLLPAGRGRSRAKEIANALKALPLTPDECAALGGSITVTQVLAPRTWNVRRAVEVVVRRREQLKAAGRRGCIDVLESALDSVAWSQ